MKCPYCGGKSAILDCRWRKAGYKWRLHECYECHQHFSTRETYLKDYSKPKAFIKGGSYGG